MHDIIEFDLGYLAFVNTGGLSVVYLMCVSCTKFFLVIVNMFGKPSKRSIRRHHNDRVKNNAMRICRQKRLYRYGIVWQYRNNANHLKRDVGYPWTGNPRKHWDGSSSFSLTRSEQISLLSFFEQLEELCI